MLNEKQLSCLMKAANDIGMRMVPVSEVSEKALHNAINSYAQEARHETVYGMRDTTLPKNGKKGYLLTDQALYNENFSYIKWQSSGLNRLPLEGLIRVVPDDIKHYQIAEYQDGQKIVFWSGAVYEESVLAILREAIKFEEEKEESKDEVAAESKSEIREKQVTPKQESAFSEPEMDLDLAAQSQTLLIDIPGGVTEPETVQSSQHVEKSALLKKVEKILEEQFDVEFRDEEGYLNERSSLREDMRVDSLDMADLMMELEEKFGVEISEQDAESFVTPGDIVSYLEKKGVKA